MPNVNAGDIAKVVSVNTPLLSSNVGMHVYVIGLNQEEYTRRYYRDEYPIWDVEILQMGKAYIIGPEDQVKLKYPGAVMFCADKHLRRIEPPKESSEEEEKGKEIRVG